jgi:hypothetical protein
MHDDANQDRRSAILSGTRMRKLCPAVEAAAHIAENEQSMETLEVKILGGITRRTHSA